MNVDYTSLLKEIDYYLVPGRTESASFLMWFLEKYYRLDKQEAIDSVCDNNGDKGVDGIYVNEGANTIDIFQTKISQTTTKTLGDTSLKEFYGTLSQFETIEKLDTMVNSAGRAQVASLVKRLDLRSKIGGYTIKGIFISNIELSSDSVAYLKKVDEIEYIGKTKLETEYISDKKKVNLQSKSTFDISTTEVTTYTVDPQTKTYIAPIKATELVQLDGIDDQSIFDYNVRGYLGNLKINKGIVSSIKNKDLHKKFPLFHNGITIVAEDVNTTEDKITLKKFYVVNGCQSLTSLHRNQTYLTDDLKILTKIIQVPIDSPLSKQITEYSNSQNGVKPRDFKSYNEIQVRLQHEIDKNFKNEYFFEIKRGENTASGTEIISNELTGINLMSFDLKEPWNTHRKYQVFEDAYAKLFARPQVTAHRVVFLHILSTLIDKNIPNITNQMIARYSLTKYAIMYTVRSILEQDVVGTKLIAEPKSFVDTKEKRDKLETALKTVLDDIIIDLNAEVKELGDEFDYKSRLRDEVWVKKLTKDITASYMKLVNRNRVNSFKQEWESK